MGLGRIGSVRTLVFKRKFRWTFRIEEVCGGRTVPEFYVKLASRPNITIDEQEINFLNGKTWIPGKGTWETITVTYYDVATADNKVLWDWLASVYDFTNPVTLFQGSHRQDYSGRAVLTLFDGCGNPIEVWTLDDVWPQAINWQELDYSNSEEVNVELTLRYSEVAYQQVCPAFTIDPCCTGCLAQ